MVAKLKAELGESFSSLKSTLEAMGALDDKCRQKNVEADEAKGRVAMLEIELQSKRVDRGKGEEEKKALNVKLEETEAFLLRINKSFFFQGVCLAAFYHGILLDDNWYDVDKEVIDGKLISLGDDDEDEVEGQGEKTLVVKKTRANALLMSCSVLCNFIIRFVNFLGLGMWVLNNCHLLLCNFITFH